MKDYDLYSVLAKSSNEDLDPLVKFIVEKGNLTETLSSSEKYKKYHPDHSKYIEEIEREIRLFGGNTFANIVRGDGPLYKEIVEDVAKKMKVKYESTDSVEEIELKILLNIIKSSYEKMNNEEKEEIKKIFEEEGIKNVDFSAGIPVSLILAQIGIKSSGFLAYKISVIVANAISKAILGRGLSLVANATLTRAIGIFAGPIGWVITGLWTLFDIAGPAYRVTVPCVLHIAYLRQKIKYKGIVEKRIK